EGVQKKCLGKMGDVAKEGRTVLFVSHNLAAIENLCSSSFLLDSGRVICEGKPRDTINHYLESVLPSKVGGFPLYERRDRSGNGRVRLTSFHIEDDQGCKVAAARSGLDVVFVFGFQCREGDSPRDVDVGLAITTSSEVVLFVLYGSYTGQVFSDLSSRGEFRCNIPKLPLSPGRYRVGARV